MGDCLFHGEFSADMSWDKQCPRCRNMTQEEKDEWAKVWEYKEEKNEDKDNAVVI